MTAAAFPRSGWISRTTMDSIIGVTLLAALVAALFIALNTARPK